MAEKIGSVGGEFINPPAGTNLSEFLMGPGGLHDTPFFRVLAIGPFSRTQIKVTDSGEALFLPEETQGRINRKWDQANEERLAGGKKPMIDALLPRLISFGIAPEGSLIIGLGSTGYKQYWGTRHLPDETRRELKWDLANPLAGTALVVSADGQILYSQRDLEKWDRPGALEVPGGMVDLDADRRGEGIDLIKTVEREIREEQAIQPGELADIKLVGLVYEQFQDAAPTYVCLAKLEKSVSQDTIDKRIRDQEGRPIWLSTKDPVALTKMFLSLSVSSTAVTLASFYFYLKTFHPEVTYQGDNLADWYLGRLRKRGEAYRGLDEKQTAELQKRKTGRNLAKMGEGVNQ